MKRFFSLLTTNDSSDALGHILQAWRLWLAGAVLGALLGWGVHTLFPPPFRAEAAVIVDTNQEDAWEYFPDRRLFVFIERESRKLEALAWSDAVLEQVAEQVSGISMPELRDEILLLSHPGEGKWRFWADYPDKATAQTLAAAWASAFADQARASITVNPEIEAIRAQINQAYLDGSPPDEEELERLGNQVADAMEGSAGISQYTEVSLSEEGNVRVARRGSSASALFLGSVIGAAGFALAGLFLHKDE